MAYNTNIKEITLNGTGTETDLVFDVTDGYSSYLLTGSAVASGNYAIVPTGIPQLGTKFIFLYNAILDLGTFPAPVYTFSLFGTPITQAQLFKLWKADVMYNGTSWEVRLDMSLTESGVISTANIENLAVTTAKINDLAVTSIKLDIDSVITSKILDKNVTTIKIDDLAVTDAQLAADSVITSKILDKNVTNAKLANMADNTIKGNISGGAASPSDISISTIISANCWSLTGNSGTTAGTNFVGTTDAVDLVFKANSIQSGRIDLSNLNTSFGYYTLASNTTGVGSTAFGTTSLQNQISGAYNTAYGYQSLKSLTIGGANTGLGSFAGDSITTGNNNTIIGYAADVTSGASLGRIALGSNAQADTNYQFALPDNITSMKFGGNSFTLPTTDGSSNAVLQTNGSKVLSFGSIVDSGTYTPGLTNVTNVAASTAYPCQWMRVGNTVTVSGKVAIDATSAAAMELGISLPIASNFANDYQCAGTGVAVVAGEDAAYIKADVINNRASLNQTKADISNHDHYFTFTYSII